MHINQVLSLLASSEKIKLVTCPHSSIPPLPYSFLDVSDLRLETSELIKVFQHLSGYMEVMLEKGKDSFFLSTSGTLNP